MLVALGLLFCGRPLSAELLEGFTEPHLTIHVSAVEAGIITEVKVREGDFVHEGDVLAVLDNDVHLALLEIAKRHMEAQGQLRSAQAELQMRRQRLAKLVELREQGYSQQEEVERARSEVEIAEAELLTVQEELLLRKLELQKIEIQLQRRSIRAPIDGIVIDVAKRPGEAVTPTDAHVLTLVQLDPLIATFSVDTATVRKLVRNQAVKVGFAGAMSNGVIEFISPVTDAESGTVRIRVSIDNAQGKYRSGERCSLTLP